MDERTPALVAAENDGVFEQGIHDLLAKLKSSHTDFYRPDRNPTKPEHAIGATLRSVTVLNTQRWMFLDVFEDSPAARSGVTPGYLLISVNGVPAVPPDYPVFRFGEEHQLTIQPPNNRKAQDIVVMVPERKKTLPRLPFVEPKSVSYRMLTKRAGTVKIAYFSGMFGIRFAKMLDAAIASLSLDSDLQAVGIRCWLDSKDLKIGDDIELEVDRAIQLTDKVLLILSQASVNSTWIRLEVANALKREAQTKKTILFPIRIDNAILNAGDKVSASLRRAKHIGDFTQWKVPDKYKRAFSRLVKDLTLSAAVEQPR